MTPKFPRNIKVLEESVIAINFIGYVKKDTPEVHSAYSEGDLEFVPPTTLPLVKHPSKQHLLNTCTATAGLTCWRHNAILERLVKAVPVEESLWSRCGWQRV